MSEEFMPVYFHVVLEAARARALCGVTAATVQSEQCYDCAIV